MYGHLIFCGLGAGLDTAVNSWLARYQKRIAFFSRDGLHDAI